MGIKLFFLNSKKEKKEFNFESWAIDNGIVLAGDDLISLKEFLKGIAYVITKNDICEKDDPRLEFIDWIKSLQLKPLIHVNGTKTIAKRLESNKKLFSD